MSEAVTTADTPAPQSVRTNRYARTAITITVIAFLCNLYLAPLGLFRCLIALFVVPVMLIAGTGFSAVWFLTRKDQKNENPAPQARRRGRFSIGWFILWLVIGGSLCWFNIPRKLAVIAATHRLNSLEQTPLKAPAKGTWIGPWRVKEAEVDDRGGLYIVTGEDLDLIDTLSVGLAYKPNPVETPFGRADYSLTYLTGGWYWFYVNNDY